MAGSGKIVEGQTHGGIAQVIGEAMWEHCYIEPESGQPLCGSFMDCGMPPSIVGDAFPALRAALKGLI